VGTGFCQGDNPLGEFASVEEESDGEDVAALAGASMTGVVEEGTVGGDVEVGVVGPVVLIGLDLWSPTTGAVAVASLWVPDALTAEIAAVASVKVARSPTEIHGALLCTSPHPIPTRYPRPDEGVSDRRSRLDLR
jgi:hypothetical protein